mmetsp:Transcript_45101/g.79357  ORF Transcript_45101/g.79357 Transcript_45101/m.79357 type:complete len:349 (+) Transcript_45101:64-1110(+)
MEPSPPTGRSVPGHVDKGTDEKRRKLEAQLLQDMEKSVARIGEGIERGLTPSYNTRQALRFSIYQPPTRTRSIPVIREASYSARERCRFHEVGDRRRLGPARARSLTPDGGERKKLAPEQQGAAGVVSNHSRRYDTPGGRSEALGHGSLRSLDYRDRYYDNAAGTTLPGAKPANQMERVATPRKGIARIGDESDANRFTTSRANREEARYHTVAAREGGSPERFGKRVSISGGSFSPRNPSPCTSRWNGKALSMFSLNGKARERSPPVSNGGTPPGSVSLAAGQAVYVPKATSDVAKEHAPSPRFDIYVPGCNDSLSARRRRESVSAYGSNVQRDIWGRDAFATMLRT